jgi:hypothetical protein
MSDRQTARSDATNRTKRESFPATGYDGFAVARPDGKFFVKPEESLCPAKRF